TALRFEPQGEVVIEVGVIQHGPAQAVCLVKVENSKTQCIVKGSFPSDFLCWDQYPLKHLLASNGVNFTQDEYNWLLAAARYAGEEGPVLSPLAFAEPSEGIYVYSQPFAPDGYLEINPCSPFYTRDKVAFAYNYLATNPNNYLFDPVDLSGPEAILTRTIQLMISVYLRSRAEEKPLLIFPSFHAGDILANRHHQIKCVGIHNMLLGQRIYEDYQRMDGNPGTLERVICRFINFFYPTFGFSYPRESFTSLGLRDLLVNQIADTFKSIYGEHSLSAAEINSYLS
ncbi:MAG: hypothetical protein V1753_12540, partial [Pseudomonadota bacterium]